MSDPNPASHRLAPGFDFLQDLVKNAGAALPNIGQWIAPTLNPEEIAKRIEELRTVQFWLEQNARMLGATIQALEVQRMTLSTLRTMNVQMGDLRESLSIRPDAAHAAAADADATAAKTSAASPAQGATAATPTPPAAGVDPMQWWGALTKQFAELATSAVQDSARKATSHTARPQAATAATQDPATGSTLKKDAAAQKAAPRRKRGSGTGAT